MNDPILVQINNRINHLKQDPSSPTELADLRGCAFVDHVF